jgi:hypothetical protein
VVTNWKDLELGYPEDFDLVEVKFEDGSMLMGWWTGHIWDGYRDFKGRAVKQWRKRNYDTITSGNR